MLNVYKLMTANAGAWCVTGNKEPRLLQKIYSIHCERVLQPREDNFEASETKKKRYGYT